MVFFWNHIIKLLSLTVSEIFNGKCDAMVNVTLNATSKQRSGSFILAPIDLSYAKAVNSRPNFCSIGRTV